MKEKLFKQNEKGLFTGIVSALICAVLISSQVLVLGVNQINGQSTNNADADRRINELIKAGKEYQTAMKAVNSLSSKSLKSEEAIIEAVKTLDRYKETLVKGGYASLFVLAANDPAFIKSVQAKVDEVGEERFAEMLKDNPKIVFDFTNAKKIQSNIKMQLTEYLKDFKNLGTNLKNAGEKSDNKMSFNNDRENLVYSLNSNFTITNASYDPISKLNSDLILQNNYEFDSNIYRNNSSIDWGKIIEAAIKLLVDAVIKETLEDYDPAPDGGPSDNDICLGKAQDKLESCLAKKGLGKWLSKSLCWGEFALNQGICAFLPQSYPNS